MAFIALNDSANDAMFCGTNLKDSHKRSKTIIYGFRLFSEAFIIQSHSVASAD